MHRKGEFLAGIPQEFPQHCRAEVFIFKDRTNFSYLHKTGAEKVQSGVIQNEGSAAAGGGAFNTGLWL